MDIHLLLKHIEEKRDCGVAHLVVFDRPYTMTWEELLIEKSKELQFFSWHAIWFYRKNKKRITEQPVTIDELNNVLKPLSHRETAITILSRLLHKDMAYSEEIMPFEDAYRLATNFVSFFAEGSHYYSGNGLTEATFDSGIIVVDNHKTGIAWFEDED